MRVFLTGTTGFVGSALLSRVVSDELAVSALVRNESVGLPGGVEKIEGDLGALSSVGDSSVAPRNDSVESAGDPSALPQDDSANIVQGDRVKQAGDLSATLKMTLQYCNVVVHAAARAHIMRDEVVDPLAEYRKVNRDATLALARLAAEAGVKRFVFVSSIGVNGNLNTRPFSETDEPHPHDAYSLSKYEAEQGLLAMAKETGMEVVIIRPPLVYGANAPGNFGSLVKWVKKVVPLPLGSVHNLRSLVALDNLVDFMALCSDPARSPKAANEVFLISDGEDVSTSDLLRKVAKAYGVKSRLLPVPVGLMKMAAKLLGKGAVADRLFGNLQVDSSKARDLLGWQPVVTMDEQLAKMAAADKSK